MSHHQVHRVSFDNIAHQIQQAERSVFESGIFEYKLCKFHIKLQTSYIPIDDDDNYKKVFKIMLVWDETPKSVDRIHLYGSFRFAEQFIRMNLEWVGSIDDGYTTLEIMDIDICQYETDTLTFTICFEKLKGINKKGDTVFSENYDPPLLSGTLSKLVKPAQHVLSVIFKQFASNEDGTMCKDDMKRYILVCGAGKASASDSRIEVIFDQYGMDEETNEDTDRLSCQGFLNFYKDACIDRPQHVWNDLKVFNYGYDFQKVNVTKKDMKFMRPIILDESPCQSNNTEIFKWCLSDHEIAKIKDCKPRDIIKSEIFELHRLRFQIWFYVCSEN